VHHSSLEFLGLVSLESIENGIVRVMDNWRLCYVDDIPWHEIRPAPINQIEVYGLNKAADDCGG